LNETPAQFVERIRVDHARGLLAENMPSKQVAVDSGFGDLQRMRRAFQRRFGVGVSEYIRALRRARQDGFSKPEFCHLWQIIEPQGVSIRIGKL